MPSDGDVKRRTNAKRTKRKNAANDSDAARRKDRKKQSRRLREERNRRAALVFFASSLFFVAVLFLYLRKSKKQPHYHGSDTERYMRAKAVLDAARSGKTLDDTRKGGGSSSVKSMRYLDPRQLPPLPGEPSEPYSGKGRKGGFPGEGDDAWQSDAKSKPNSYFKRRGPKVDYTKHEYEYPDIMYDPPNDGTYPALEKMSTIFETWGQDDLDSPPDTLVEVLQHFDFQDQEQMEAATKYRDLELPFKVYNIPEVRAAHKKWTDEYVASHFNGENDDDAPQSRGSCQQSQDNFFAFHRPPLWSVELLGAPPSVDLEWTFDKWARHAVYADEVSLPKTEKHYYFQSGVNREERHKKWKHWTFVSRDLPSFSNPEPTFFGFNPPAQKGIQCRFGERGVTAATHYDGGRNMIAMITGAKRYVLSPPFACPQLGIVTSREHPSYRHSMLNFGRVTLLDEDDGTVEMSKREKEWLRISADAPTLSTVLKAGEVLYVPSHWFHYITSLQKSAQCNTRSGMHEEGNENFGGLEEVEDCIKDGDD
eukprot:CAMPEP_0196148568 /NCGR_PEP_ID=MMETSP0910-20130528/27977_1 /TAXON_ID=49265 /ORGANISM="Thalassiosira rotula, Strain GSO102" /LENGTH=535 /DNA_ID=CAMNT_0041411297 /DNA_START=77 /DNA_END=1684 /DNA_ORIENTATION=-